MSSIRPVQTSFGSEFTSEHRSLPTRHTVSGPASRQASVLPTRCSFEECLRAFI